MTLGNTYYFRVAAYKCNGYQNTAYAYSDIKVVIPVAVTADAQTKVYGDVDPFLSFSSSNPLAIFLWHDNLFRS